MKRHIVYITSKQMTHLFGTLHWGHHANCSSETRAQNAFDWLLAAVCIVALHWDQILETQWCLLL